MEVQGSYDPMTVAPTPQNMHIGGLRVPVIIGL